jgi:hypothetical protein
LNQACAPSLAAEQLTARQNKKYGFKKLLKRFDDEARMGLFCVRRRST